MIPETPEVVALPVDRAVLLLREKNDEPEIVKTYPTKSFKGSGQWRVVRQTHAQGKTVLVIAETCEGVL